MVLMKVGGYWRDVWQRNLYCSLKSFPQLLLSSNYIIDPLVDINSLNQSKSIKLIWSKTWSVIALKKRKRMQLYFFLKKNVKNDIQESSVKVQHLIQRETLCYLQQLKLKSWCLCKKEVSLKRNNTKWKWAKYVTILL